MEKPKLLIADGSGEYGDILSRLLQAQYQIYQCADGIQAMKLLNSLKPDILVLDLILPELDGISLLRSAAFQENRPRVLALSPLVNSYITDTLEQLKVEYLIRIPCSMSAICDQIHALIQYVPTSHSSTSAVVSRRLTELGFCTSHIGYSLLRDAIAILYETPGSAVTKHIYPELAKKYRIKPTQVERDMRTAIEHAWDSPSHDRWLTFFSGDTRPSNGVFLSRITESLVQEVSGR